MFFKQKSTHTNAKKNTCTYCADFLMYRVSILFKVHSILTGRWCEKGPASLSHKCWRVSDGVRPHDEDHWSRAEISLESCLARGITSKMAFFQIMWWNIIFNLFGILCRSSDHYIMMLRLGLFGWDSPTVLHLSPYWSKLNDATVCRLAWVLAK